MLQDYLTLRQAYLTRPDTRTQIHQNYVRNLFLYETFRLGGHNLPPTIFENIVSTGKPQSTETTRQAYDLWQAWQYCEKQAALRQPLDLSFVRTVSARIMKHTGGETTTSVGRYDTSLGDFRLGEDYDEVYPLADFRKIPLLLDNLCRTTDVQLTEAGVSENIKIVANFMYDFMHIKPFGYCNLETGILLINFLELKEEHPLLILFADDRAELLNALKRNTAEVAFYGMLQGLDDYLNEEKVQQIAALGHNPNMEELEVILSRRIRSEKVAIKDIKLRTFIAEGNSRNDLAAHVYDITYGSLVPGVDNLVIIDDSIVRGTTLKQSIIGILDRLGPKKIVIVSSSPQVRYPDYYGIDMAKMSEFIAFRAAVELLKERDMKDVIAAAYRKSKEQVGLPKEQMVNYVKDIYAPFTDEEISAKMVELLTPKGTKAKVEIVYQPLEGLHEACPHHKGDWYFSGNYPTPGGVKMVNRAFIDYIEQMYQF